MIAHFLEVWVILVVVFVLGCAIGALSYEFLAQSGAAAAQLTVTDAVGDIIDRVKRRLGINPAWREYRSVPIQVAPAPAPGPMPVSDVDFVEAVAAELEVHTASLEPEPSAEDRPQHDEAPQPHDEVLPPHDDSLPPATAGDAPLVEIDSLVPVAAASLNRPRQGIPDNLQRIRGIGKKNETLLNRLGIFHFGQIAAWTPAEILWIGQYIAFPERIIRDNWIGQAVTLASGGETGVTKSADRRRLRRISEAATDPFDEAEPLAGDDQVPNRSVTFDDEDHA